MSILVMIASGPNVISNPLSNHSEPKINAVLEGSTEGRKICIEDVITPMRVIHEKLVQARVLQSRKKGAIKEKRISKDYYQYHAKLQGHMIQKRIEFRDIV